MGWKIVAHSFALLFRNLTEALKVSIGPFALAIVFGALAVVMAGGGPQSVLLAMDGGEAAPAVALALLAAMMAVVVASAWVAIAWHRFVLVEEYPGLLPKIPSGVLGGYIWRSFTLGLMMVFIAIPLSAIAGIVLGLTGLSGFVLAEMAASFAVATALSYLWLRLAIVLPAIALGRPMNLPQAWAAGSPHAGEILKAAAILVAVNLVGSRILALLPLPDLLGLAAQLVLTWVTMMAGTSILTSLYGVLIEKRSLN